MPRPKLPPEKKKASAIQLRLNDEDRGVFERLAESLEKNELRGVTVTDAGVLRWLVSHVAEERGLLAPTKPKRAAPRR